MYVETTSVREEHVKFKIMQEEITNIEKGPDTHMVQAIELPKNPYKMGVSKQTWETIDLGITLGPVGGQTSTHNKVVWSLKLNFYNNTHP